MRVKLAGALIATLMVFGLIFGVGQAAAASLPGSPLYGLKLTAEQARMELTSSPEAKAELAAELAQNRLSEVAQMVANGTEVDGETAFKVQQQVSLAFQAANQVSGDGQLKFQAQNRLRNILLEQHQVMASAVDAAPQQQEPVRALLRSVERVRAELHTGEGEASGQQNRTNWDADPNAAGPAGQPGGASEGQTEADGLLDGTGTGVPSNHYNDDAQLGPGSPEGTDGGAMGPYDGVAPSYGPGPAEDNAPIGFQWLWNLFKRDPKSGSGSSGSGSSGSNSSGSGSSGSSSSGNGNR